MIKTSIYWLWTGAQGLRTAILLNSVVGMLRVCASLLFVWVCKQLIDIASRATDNGMRYYTVLLIAIVIIELALLLWSNYLENKNNIRLKNKLRQQLFTGVMLSTWSGKERFHSGDVLNRLEEDVRLCTETVCKSLPSMAVAGFQLLAAFFFLNHLDSRLSWAVLAIMPLFLLISKVYIKRMHHLTKEIRSSDSRIQAHMQEKIQHKTLIQTLGQNRAVVNRLAIFQAALYRQVMRQTSFTLFSRTLVMTGFATGYVVAFLWGVEGISTGTISFGVMAAFLQLVGQVQRPIVDMGSRLPALVNALASAERLEELNSLQLEKQGESIILNGAVGIRFDAVSFAYPDGDREIVKGFSYNFVPGSRTAIVGETGVGKSTLIRLMLALLYPQKGKIDLYNEKQTIETCPLTRCNMVYVPQGNTLLSGTIRDNLLMGNPNATEEELANVLTTAVAGFVYDFPEGLDTLCGEGGAGLSEGQAQRIGIARGLLRPGSILLLDEFSSSLDSPTERLLMERLLSQTKDKTLIFITHRERVAKYCERVIRIRSF